MTFEADKVPEAEVRDCQSFKFIFAGSLSLT